MLLALNAIAIFRSSLRIATGNVKVDVTKSYKNKESVGLVIKCGKFKRHLSFPFRLFQSFLWIVQILFIVIVDLIQFSKKSEEDKFVVTPHKCRKSFLLNSTLYMWPSAYISYIKSRFARLFYMIAPISVFSHHL